MKEKNNAKSKFDDVQINVRIPKKIYDWTESQRDKTDRTKLVRLGLEILQFIDFDLLEELASKDGLKLYAMIEFACLHFSSLSANERAIIRSKLDVERVNLRSAQKGGGK